MLGPRQPPADCNTAYQGTENDNEVHADRVLSGQESCCTDGNRVVDLVEFWSRRVKEWLRRLIWIIHPEYVVNASLFATQLRCFSLDLANLFELNIRKRKRNCCASDDEPSG